MYSFFFVRLSNLVHFSSLLVFCHRVMAKRHKKKFAENMQGVTFLCYFIASLERGKFQDKQNRRVAVDKTGTSRLPIRVCAWQVFLIFRACTISEILAI